MSKDIPLPDETDLQQLADLMTHRGWVLFRSHCEREWGDGGFGRRVAAVMKARGPDVAGPILAQMTVAQSEIQALLDWPTKRIADLKAQDRREEALASPSRRPLGL